MPNPRPRGLMEHAPGHPVIPTDLCADDTAGQVVIDVGGPTERRNPDDIPSVQVNLAGKIYTAYCPKDLVWMSAVRALNARTVTGAAEHVFNFLDGAFAPETAAEIARRGTDVFDPLDYEHWIEPTLPRLIDHFVPDAKEQFEAMGLDLEADDLPAPAATTETSANRATRRAAKSKRGPASKRPRVAPA